MYEHPSSPPIPRRAFFLRMLGAIGAAMAVAFLSLAAGMVGYRYFEGMPWIDCFLNAAMILGGMGEIDPLKTDGGKIFAGFFALYSGLWVVASMGIILAPVLHRVLHHFHHRAKT